MPQATVTLGNGVEMPALGFGVFQTPAEATAAAVAEALQVGYRLIDTAASYFNERGVGEGIRRSGLDRAEVFIETNVWISDYGYEQTLHAFDKSARKLGVDQIDLLLLHQPVPTQFDNRVAETAERHALQRAERPAARIHPDTRAAARHQIPRSTGSPRAGTAWRTRGP
jgi:diketogulonate reductase-like aldo/keto reductase